MRIRERETKAPLKLIEETQSKLGSENREREMVFLAVLLPSTQYTGSFLLGLSSRQAL